MSTPASARWGYDATEIMAIIESILGTTPATGSWLHFGHPLGIDPRPQPQWSEKTGIGRQIISDQEIAKKWGEATLNYELEKKDADVGYEYEWMDLLAYILGDDGNSATVVDEKHLGSLSIGSKLDLETDEYWLFKGCKLNTVEIRGNILANDPVRASLGIKAQDYSYTTTDYVSGDATRKTFPNTGRIFASDCDIEIPTGASIYDRISDWTFRINRNLVGRGGKSGNAQLFRNWEEGKLEVELEVVMDFDDKTELDDFLAATARTAKLELPLGTGGRAITLTSGKWREMSKPTRELDLIALTLRAKYTDISVGTI